MKRHEIINRDIQDAWDSYHIRSEGKYDERLAALRSVNARIPSNFRLDFEKVMVEKHQQPKEQIEYLAVKLQEAHVDWLENGKDD